VGFGERGDELPFYAPQESNMAGGTFRSEDKEKTLSGRLRIVAGDEYFRGVPMVPVGIIKVDVEGFEEPALKGLRKTIEAYRPLVILEVTTPHHQVVGTIASLDQLKALFPADYQFLMFEENQRQYLDGNYDVREFASVADRFFATEKQKNLVVVPAEKLPVVPRRRAARP
jgi:hypothetical protein